MVFDYRLLFPPLSEPKRVLDCGYGSAAWAIEVAEQYPDCEVRCLSQNRLQAGRYHSGMIDDQYSGNWRRHIATSTTRSYSWKSMATGQSPLKRMIRVRPYLDRSIFSLSTSRLWHFISCPSTSRDKTRETRPRWAGDESERWHEAIYLDWQFKPFFHLPVEPFWLGPLALGRIRN